MRTDTYTSWAGVLGAHRGDLVRAARSKLDRGADAEDVVHDVVVRVLRGGRSGELVEAPVAYLRRAVANECVSRWRRGAHEVLVDDLPDRPGGRDEAEGCVQRLALRRALAVLPDQQRRVILLSLLQDRPDDEISRLLGIAPVTVRTTRRRALARLRELLNAADRADLPHQITPAVPAVPAASTIPAAQVVPAARAQRTTRSAVTRITTRTVPDGSTSYGRPRYLADSASINSLPPASVKETRPRISA